MYCIRWVMILSDYQPNNTRFKPDSIRPLPQKSTSKEVWTNKEIKSKVIGNNWIESDFPLTGTEKSELLIRIITNGPNGFSFNCSILIMIKKPIRLCPFLN